MISKVADISPMLGCDPEFFFKSKGEVIGAEKFIPEEGIAHDANHGGQSKFIIDGVQAELNPSPSNCRANLANEIAACFNMLSKQITKSGKDISVDFSRTIEISKENLMELNEKAREFGCAPSMSTNKKKAAIKINKIDPMEYRIRAAGGHIHIGKTDFNKGLTRALTTDHIKTVNMLDILCGNTAVLVDRDEGNIERRKVYGRAGEFRLPEHGLEYRTLSNFWLTAYPLMSFSFGMARLAVQLVADERHSDEFYEAFTSSVKAKKIRDAINNNDFDLAMENFKRIEKLMLEVLSNTGSRYAIDASNIKEFYYFVDKIKTKGLTYWFKQEPLQHWTKNAAKDAHNGGFNDYLVETVRDDMKAAA